LQMWDWLQFSTCIATLHAKKINMP
jgi:hypothetical protein